MRLIVCLEDGACEWQAVSPRCMGWRVPCIFVQMHQHAWMAIVFIDSDFVSAVADDAIKSSTDSTAAKKKKKKSKVCRVLDCVSASASVSLPTPAACMSASICVVEISCCQARD